MNSSFNNNDELAQLATCSNSMQLKLRQLIKIFSRTSEKVAASSEELTTIAEQNTQVSAQIAASIELVALGTVNK
jgi:methyl-accepting chemotaxis protein